MADRLDGERRENHDELLMEVYDELRRLARWRLSGDALKATLQATALVHEAVLRLSSPDPNGWQSRGHLFAAQARRRPATRCIARRTSDAGMRGVEG